MKMDKESRKKLYNAYKRCPHYFFDYTTYHMFNGLENKEYFVYTDYAVWLTTMGMLDTLKMVDEKSTLQICNLSSTRRA